MYSMPMRSPLNGRLCCLSDADSVPFWGFLFGDHTVGMVVGNVLIATVLQTARLGIAPNLGSFKHGNIMTTAFAKESTNDFTGWGDQDNLIFERVLALFFCLRLGRSIEVSVTSITTYRVWDQSP